jgi:hypothetical protein
MRRLLLSFCLCGLAPAGCAVPELRDDQDKIRGALLDLYTNQIIDNLIRASNGMPIIQLDYINAAANITVMESANLSDSLVTTRSSAAAPSLTGTSMLSRAVAGTSRALTVVAGTTFTITRSTMNTLMGGGSASNSNQVAVTASPVTTSNEVYDAYLAFLTLPGSLQASPQPPPEGAAHICKKCGNVYYWVPAEYKKEFLGLALATTAQRGRPIPAPEAYEVILKEILDTPVKEDADLYSFTVKLDHKIPNDSGKIVFDDGAVLTFDAYTPPMGPQPSETDRLKLYLDLRKAPLGAKSVEAFRAKLPLTKPVKAYVRGRRPEPPTTNDLLNRTNFQLQQIQFNQLRTGGL